VELKVRVGAKVLEVAGAIPEIIEDGDVVSSGQ